jgi:hypothetical protein
MKEGEPCCSICQRELNRSRAADVQEDIEMCIECGEYPAESGEELCAACLAESRRLMENEAEAERLRKARKHRHEDDDDAVVEEIPLDLVDDGDDDVDEEMPAELDDEFHEELDEDDVFEEDEPFEMSPAGSATLKR